MFISPFHPIGPSLKGLPPWFRNRNRIRSVYLIGNSISCAVIVCSNRHKHKITCSWLEIKFSYLITFDISNI